MKLLLHCIILIPLNNKICLRSIGSETITSHIVFKSSKLLMPLSCLLNYASKNFCTTYCSFPLHFILNAITKHYIYCGKKYLITWSSLITPEDLDLLKAIFRRLAVTYFRLSAQHIVSLTSKPKVLFM